MKPASPEQALFHEALLLTSPAAREAYLHTACGEDATLRQRVAALLQAAEEAGDFLEQPPTALAAAALPGQPSEKPGDRIGRYKLLEQIGEGGCGVVYMAEQEEPVRRRVALKVIKLGMDTRSVIARFEAERQALALMDHPNIARVFDGGATASGRPYFVMELVRGVRITEFCEVARLPTPARLQLFMQVCQAVQHAHHQGVIHRDLKPSNILVTINDGVPVPKVIDFGIAKATGQRLTDKTLFTQFHAFIGTPAYTSPEQAEMSSVDIDTRSDIYSLGVLLYELLTGRTPFDGEELLRSGLDEMRRIIRDVEPPQPSARLTTLVAAARRAPPGPGPVPVTAPGPAAPSRLPPSKELIHSVQGDLDWIVMKCLEKDRARRYETASDIASDLRRHLDNEPIEARPPGAVYRLQKLVRRRRGLCAALAAVAIAVVAGVATSAWQAIRARRGELRASAALAELRAGAPAFAAQARGLAARGQFAEALEKFDYAIALRPDHTEYLLAKANLLESRLRFADAVPVRRAVLRLAPDHPGARTNLALCEQLERLGDAPSAARDEALARLFVVMRLERRADPEMALVAGLVLDAARKQLAGLEVLAGRAPDQFLTLKPGGLLDLDLIGLPITDLRPFSDLPLGKINLAGTRVADLRPLAGSPLVLINIAGTGTTNLEPLRGMQTLRSVSFEHSAITDLAPLQGLPIEWVNLNGTSVSDLRPLRGMPVTTLRLRNTAVTDLTPVAGLPLIELDCTAIPAVDFSPLADCPSLQQIYLTGTAITNLGLFRRCRLRELRFDNTAVRDLSPLAGMPLAIIRCYDSPVTDLAPLAHCPELIQIGLPQGSGNVAALRALPKLSRISWRRDSRGDPAETAAAFWGAWDAANGGRP